MDQEQKKNTKEIVSEEQEKKRGENNATNEKICFEERTESQRTARREHQTIKKLTGRDQVQNDSDNRIN